MAEVLLLGTFHFMENPLDFFSANAQEELERLVQRLCAFSPNAVALEAPIRSQAQLDASYHRFSLADLRDPDKMKRETLGTITLYGSTCPITYNNEAVQIGYRLGKLLGHERIFAIDDDFLLDTSVMQTALPALMTAQQAFSVWDDAVTVQDGIPARLRHINTPEWSQRNHDLYIQANAIPNTGVPMVAAWYKRNLNIFSNIQRLAAGHERIFVLFGAGHLAILRSLIRADSNLKLVDINTFL